MKKLIFLFFLISLAVSIETNYTKYRDYIRDKNLVGAVYFPIYDAWSFGGESWWILFPFFTLAFLVWNRSNSEALVASVSYLFIIVFNGFFPLGFLFPAGLLFITFLTVVAVMVAKG
jgi:hypothetical protein